MRTPNLHRSSGATRGRKLRQRVRAPFMALTATATPKVREDIIDVLGLMDPVRVVGSFDRPNLSWHIRRADDHRSKVRVL